MDRINYWLNFLTVALTPEVAARLGAALTRANDQTSDLVLGGEEEDDEIFDDNSNHGDFVGGEYIDLFSGLCGGRSDKGAPPIATDPLEGSPLKRSNVGEECG